PRRARWFDPLATSEMHLYKPLQLETASALGVRVPEAIISTELCEIRDFCDRHARVVMKPCSSFAYARVREDASASDGAETCAFPTMLEECVPGVDVLAYAIDGQVFAAEIAGSTTLDYSASDGARFVRVDLPLEVEAACLALARALGSRVAAIDFRKEPNGE